MARSGALAEHRELMKRLAGDEGPFSTLAEVLTFAAAFGFSEGRREPLAGIEEPIDYDVFQRMDAEGFINMLAASEDENVGILGPDMDDERLTIFEEYANGGLTALQGRLAQTRGELDNLLAVVLAHERDAAGGGGDEEIDFGPVVDELTG